MTANAADERKLRKRLQNRANQRERRSRQRQETQTNSNSHRPYRVDRWRYTYHHDTEESNKRSDAVSDPASSQCHAVSSLALRCRVPDQAASNQVATHHFTPCPTQDHLLHLIQVNLLRGLFDNKLALLSCADYLTIGAAAELQITAPWLVFPGRAAIVPSAGDIPGSLWPTPLQSTVIHATCIDLVPFAELRDRMIAWEGRFDFADLLHDLIGNLVDPTCFFTGLPGQKKSMTDKATVLYHGQEDQDYTANRNGLILWGEAHLPESWEVTLGFLRKWGWLIEGCQDLIDSSNRWRMARGEEPLTLCTSARVREGLTVDARLPPTPFK
ncbi:hypothetical protein A9K55_002734 [Cordyceps militaris]|uniref:BZIP domain-containing protein n=1 Tax=Cordyceps militaris TaxID=73501 RepID=A0A2H4S5R6_CORMI|nr:hypothetical protein A9K55_002734 [Cordyceps militaris]